MSIHSSETQGTVRVHIILYFMLYSTDDNLDELPHVLITSDDIWDPTKMIYTILPCIL